MKKINLLFVFVSLISLVSAHIGEDNSSHHGMMGGFYGWGMGFFGWIFMVLIIVVLVLFIIWLVKQIQEPKERKRKN